MRYPAKCEGAVVASWVAVCNLLSANSPVFVMQLAHRDEVLTQELKGVLDACMSSTAGGSGAGDLGSSLSHDTDDFSSVQGAGSPGSEWDSCTQQSHAHPSGTAPPGNRAFRRWRPVCFACMPCHKHLCDKTASGVLHNQHILRRAHASWRAIVIPLCCSMLHSCPSCGEARTR